MFGSRSPLTGGIRTSIFRTGREVCLQVQRIPLSREGAGHAWRPSRLKTRRRMICFRVASWEVDWVRLHLRPSRLSLESPSCFGLELATDQPPRERNRRAGAKFAAR